MSDAQSLPEEMVFDILTRLPMKSVCRFKRVCKTWLSIISDPKFEDSHFARSKSRQKLLITTCSEHFPQSRCWWDHSTRECSEHGQACSMEESRCLFIADQESRRSSLVLKHQVTIPVERFQYTDLEIEISPGDSQSVGGLMFGLCSQDFIRIANPSTKICIAIPRAFRQHSFPFDSEWEYDRLVRSVSFGFDPVEGKHKILESSSILDSRRWSKVERVDYRVATVGGDCSTNWRSVEDAPHINHRGIYEPEICVNGVIYYVATVDNYYPEKGQREMCMVAFDVRSETFQVVKLSIQGRFDYSPNPWKLVEFEGKVAIVDYPYSNMDYYYEHMVHTVDLWVLKDFQNQVWSLNFSGLPSPLKTDFQFSPKHKLVGTTFDGELMFSVFEGNYETTQHLTDDKDVSFSLFFFDIKTGDSWTSKVHLPPGFPMSGKVRITAMGHVETLLSVS